MPNLSNTVTFLFAGDGSLASEGLSLFLQTKSNFLMVSECESGAAAVTAIQTHLPVIAVIDSHLPDMSGSQIIEAVRATNKDTRIIVLGGTADRDVADQLLAAGADAYIVRSGPSRHLNEAIRYVLDGGKYLAPQLTSDHPVSAQGRSDVDHEAVSSLRTAVETQARTVERLEQAMDRAQCAIELLQQKVEQLTGTPVEAPASTSSDGPRRMMTGTRSAIGAVAAALMVGLMGFMLAGVLRPTVDPALLEFSTAGSEDALKAGSMASLHLSGWELETVDKASALAKSQQYAAAEKLCRSVLKQNPANMAASRILASVLFHQNRIEESADVVRTLAVPSAHNTPAPRPRLSFDN